MARGIGIHALWALIGALGCADGSTSSGPDLGASGDMSGGGPLVPDAGGGGSDAVEPVRDSADDIVAPPGDVGPPDTLTAQEDETEPGPADVGGVMDAGALDAPDAPDAPDAADTADSQAPLDGVVDGDAAEVPKPTCGDCTPHSDNWCGDDGKATYTCSYSPPAKGVEPCWHTELLLTCTQGWCDGGPGCYCGPVPGTTCAPNAPYWVYEKTECTSNYARGPELERCDLPGCFGGACLPPAPKPIYVFPRPFGHQVRSVRATGPGTVLVGLLHNGLFELHSGEWTDHSQYNMPQQFSEVNSFDDGTQVAVSDWGFWHRPPGGDWSMTALPMVQSVSEGTGWAPSPGRMWSVRDFATGLWTCDAGEVKVLPVAPGCQNGHVLDVWGTHPDRPILVGTGGCAYELVDGQWKVVAGLKNGNETNYRIHGTSGGQTMMAVRGSTVLRRVSPGIWTPVLTVDSAPSDASYYPGVRVFAPDDAWAWGMARTWHFDGTAWTERETGLVPGGPLPFEFRHIRDLDCFAPDDCFLGGSIFLLHWDGQAWSHISDDLKVVHDAPKGIRSIYAPSATVVYSGYAGGIGTPWNPPGHTRVTVRRFELSDGTLIHWDEWEVGDCAFWWEFPRGHLELWGTSATDVYAAAEIPMHFDGVSWAPLDLPSDLLKDYAAVSLTGHGDDLWIGLGRRQGDPYGLIAHRKTTGGAWDFVDLTPKRVPIRLVWDPNASALYGSGWGVYRINPDGSEDLISPGNGFGEDQWLGVDSESTMMFVQWGGTPIVMLPPYSGALQDYLTFPYLGSTTPGGLAPNPKGRGFLVAGNMGLSKWGTPDVDKLTVPVDPHTQVKPFGYFSAASEAIVWTPWGDVWGGSGQALMVFPGALP